MGRQRETEIGNGERVGERANDREQRVGQRINEREREWDRG